MVLVNKLKLKRNYLWQIHKNFSNKSKNYIHNSNLNTMVQLRAFSIEKQEKAVGEIKKLVTDYRKASVEENK